MKNIIPVSIMSLITIFANITQSSAQSLEELRAEIKLMKRDNTIRDSIEYLSTKYLIITAVEERKYLVFDFNNVLRRIESDALYTKLINANNPASEILGTSYISVVNQAADNYLTSGMSTDDKPRFLDIVSKIVKNPIISAVLQSNPVTGVVSSITNAAANFFNNTPVGKSVKELKIKTDNIIDQNKLDAFNKELAPYISFYDNMININNHYLIGVEQLENKYSYLQEEVSTFSNELLQPLALDLNSNIPITEQVQNKFLISIDGSGNKNYRTVLNDSNINKTKSVALNYKIIESHVNNFKEEYNELLKKYLLENIRYLTSAKSIPVNNGLDPAKINELIDDINKYIFSLGGASKNYNECLITPCDFKINAF